MFSFLCAFIFVLIPYQGIAQGLFLGIYKKFLSNILSVKENIGLNCLERDPQKLSSLQLFFHSPIFHMFIHSLIYPSIINLSIHPSIYPSINQSIHQSIYPSIQVLFNTLLCSLSSPMSKWLYLPDCNQQVLPSLLHDGDLGRGQGQVQ